MVLGGSQRSSMGSIYTGHGRQPGDPWQPRPPALILPGPGLSVPGTSRRRSLFSSFPNSPVRRESLSFAKRLSLGASLHAGRVSFSRLPPPQPAPGARLEMPDRSHPGTECQFNVGRVQQLMQDTLDTYLGDSVYDPTTCGPLSRDLSDLVRSRVREANPPRYKLVCLVVLGQRGNFGLRVASRSLWDAEKDNSAVALFQNSSLFAVAMVHGVFCE